MTIRPWGTEGLVNTTTAGNQTNAVVTALQNGGYVVAWEGFSGGNSAILYQRFDAFGNKVGAENAIVGSGFPFTPFVNAPAIETLDSGEFVIAYMSSDPGLKQVRFVRCTPDGTIVQNSSVYSALTPTNLGNPEISVNASGFDIYYDYTLGGNPPEVDYRRFNNAGAVAPGGGAWIASLDGYSGEASVLATGSPNPMGVVTADRNGDYYILIKALSGAGFEGLVATSTAPLGQPDVSEISWNGSRGRYVVSWVDGTGNIAVSLFDFTPGVGLISGGPLALSGAGSGPETYVFADGTFAVLWSAPSGTPSQQQIKLQLFSSATGLSIGGEYIVNMSSASNNSVPEVTKLADGRLVVVWTDLSVTGDGNGASIMQHIIDPRDGTVNGSNIASVTETLIGHDTVNDIMRGYAGNDTLVGLGGADSIYGGDGLDTLYGGRGDDTLYGGADRDVMFGELGNDDLYGENGLDLMRGGDGNDRLFGGADNDSMYAEGDNDTLIGGLGMDYLEGGSGFDLASYETALQGIRVDMVFRSGNTFDAIGDTFVNVEGLTGTNFADFLTSTYGDDTVNGLGGVDYIDARSGNDILSGGSGADQIYAGDGNDVLEGGLDNDYLDGGNNIDTASYANAGNGVRVDMINGAVNTNEAAGDVLYQIENLTGSILNDFLLGDNNNNVLSGGDSDDELTGRGGIDTLLGGQGADTLIGGLGNDIMDGGGDADIFRYDSGTFNADTINNFQDNLDKFNMAGSGLTFASFTITQSGADTLMTAAGGNTITLTNFIAANITAADFL